VREDERVARRRPEHPVAELLDAAGLDEAAAEADRPEVADALDAERGCELRVVAELRMGVQREVVRDEGEVGGEERLQPAALAAVDPERLVAPEQAVVDEHELRARGGRTLEQLERGRDAARDPRDLLGPDDLEPGAAVLREALDLEQLVREGDDLVPGGHRAIVGRALR
jgi:hypothetical protein